MPTLQNYKTTVWWALPILTFWANLPTGTAMPTLQNYWLKERSPSLLWGAIAFLWIHGHPLDMRLDAEIIYNPY
ncbi:MAG: hypothetical protein AB4426_34685 [Xenococcaceae cyanobacterium]